MSLLNKTQTFSNEDKPMVECENQANHNRTLNKAYWKYIITNYTDTFIETVQPEKNATVMMIDTPVLYR